MSRETAETFLRERLAGGPALQREVKADSEGAGLAWATVRRAQAKLGIQPTRVAESGDGLGGRGRWYWSLPAQPSPKVLNEPLRCSSQGMSTLGENEHLRTPGPPHEHPTDDDPGLPDNLRHCDHCGRPGTAADPLRHGYYRPRNPAGNWLHTRCKEAWQAGGWRAKDK